MSGVIPLSAELRLTGSQIGTQENSLDLEDLQTCIQWGLIVVNEIGAIVFATKRARVFLAAGCGLAEKAGRLRIERSGVDRSLRQLIRLNISAPRPERQQNIDVLGVPDREGRTHYVVRVMPFGNSRGCSHALIAVCNLLESSPVNRSVIATVFNFSAREAELSELFCKGYRVEEIASRMGVATNTIRVHLRNVLAKTGCASQIELARTFARLF